MAEIKIRKAAENITKQHKYDIIDDYIHSGLSVSEIANRYNTTESNIELIVTRHYKALSNMRETRVLLANQTLQCYKSFKTEVLDPEKINESFLEKLSEPDSLVLSDNEVVFAELYNYDGDEVKALEESKLNVGLKKARDPKDREEYTQALLLRAFYLRRKPNVASYIQRLQEEKLKAIVNGKGFIQSELLSVIEKVRNSSGDRNVMTHLKAISELARTYGAFEDKMIVEGLDGDSAINRILAKAREAKGEVIDQEYDG